MTTWVRKHWAKISAGAFLVAVAAAGGERLHAAYYGGDGCCGSGAACCKPGAPCCHHENKEVAQNH